MFKKYYLGGLLVIGILLAGVVVFSMPERVTDLRFTSFFDKFAPIEKVNAEENNNETISPLIPSQPIPVVQPIEQAQPLQPINNDGVAVNNPPPATCRVNGVDMPGDCAQYPPPSDNASGGSVAPPMPVQPNNQAMQPGPNEEQMAKQQAERLKDMQRSIKPLKNSLATFEKLMAKGNTLSDALKVKITQAKEIVAKIENAKSAEEISNDDMDNLRELMNNLEEERQSMQRLTEFRRNISNTERGVKNFESQLTRLQKQKIVVPADVTENLNKIKQLISVVKIAKSWEEMQTAGVEDMGDLMDTLNESRNNLEMLARWPQTLKQMNKEVVNLDRQVKKDKGIVDRLLKKGIDLTENYNKFVEMVNKIKVVRDEANSKMAAGDSENAFNLVQDDFFGQLEETYQNAKVIEIMNNLGAFTSSFKSELNKAKQQINQLGKKKIDVTELQAIYNETKIKGDETMVLVKTKPIDEEAVITAMEEMQNLRVDFGEKVSELQGEDAVDMPWEQGNQQFKAVQMTSDFNQYFSQPQQPINGGASKPTCNVGGIEMQGSCDQYQQR